MGITQRSLTLLQSYTLNIDQWKGIDGAVFSRHRMYQLYDTQKVYRPETTDQTVDRNYIKYETYGSSYKLSMSASVGFMMV